MAIENLTEELIYSCKDGAAKLTLNRPERLNAITQTMFDGIEQVVDEVKRNDDVKVLVITGAGRGFCSGADVVARLATQLTEGALKKNHKEIVKTLEEELAYPGVSVIIPRRECIVAVDKRMRDKFKNTSLHTA